MTEVRFHPGDPKRPARSVRIGARLGMVAAGLLVLSGTLMVLGLFAAPDLVSDLIRSADRLALRETARRSREALASVGRRLRALEGRLSADELFLARVALLADVPLPPEFPHASPEGDPDTASAESELFALARRVRAFEAMRRRIAAAAPRNATRIPSRSPIEPNSAVVLGLFGPRISPLTHRPEFYSGLTLAATAGTTVMAPAEGKVAFVGTAPQKAGATWRSLGTLVVLAHDPETRTVFGHLGKTLVKRGQTVRRGDPIGLVGQSGWAPSPRLHYEVRLLVSGRFLPVDPRLYILDVDWITAAEVRSRPPAPADLDLPPILR